MSSSTSPPPPSYWCYRCNRFIRLWPTTTTTTTTTISCPDCHSGFIEQIHSPPPPSSTTTTTSSPRLRRSTRHTTSTTTSTTSSPFNPVIVLRDSSSSTTPPQPSTTGYELFYDDGAGSGLRPLPSTVSDFLLGSGFDRLLDQLAHIELSSLSSRPDHPPPASKSAIDAMPTVSITDHHVSTDTHCAVCKDPFEIHSSAKQMPCDHLYHPDCILPWLHLRNSCPVCRHQLPSDNNAPIENIHNHDHDHDHDNDEAVGLTIWRLPGGGFAVGRFSGGRRGGERELPVVYTEMDGGFNQGGVPRRITWGSRGGRSSESGGFWRALRGLFSCFGGAMQSSQSSSSSSSDSRVDNNGSRRSRSLSLFNSSSSSRRRRFDMGSRIQRW